MSIFGATPRSRSVRRPVFVLYTAVLPAYRQCFLQLMRARLGDGWAAYAGDVFLDASVRTDVSPDLYTRVVNRFLFGRRFFVQFGHWRDALAATTTIVDLNPRSATAWILMLTRKALGRRTLVWGHLDPRRGPHAPTARVRTGMRRIADGCVLYTYASAERLRRANPNERVWVAPNALYPRGEYLAEPYDRDLIIFSGRLEPPKKPQLLLDAFCLIARNNQRPRLVFVGAGRLRRSLEARARVLGLADRVCFLGEIHEPSALRALYARALCSVSPGFVGLSLTQSLGFGVPMVVAQDEPHSPEIELADLGHVVFFARDSVADLAHALQSRVLLIAESERAALAQSVSELYSADAMADGFIDALHGNRWLQKGDRSSARASDRSPESQSLFVIDQSRLSEVGYSPHLTESESCTRA